MSLYGGKKIRVVKAKPGTIKTQDEIAANQLAAVLKKWGFDNAQPTEISLPDGRKVLGVMARKPDIDY